MNCQEVMELMQRQLDDDLNAQEEELMRAHLEHCLDCAKMFERLQKLSAELMNLPKVEPAYSLVDAILPKLNEIDLQAAAVASDSAIPLVTVESVAGAKLPRKLPLAHRFGSQISWKLAGGVVAAGLVIGFLIFGTNNPLSQNADGLLQPKTKAESKFTASAGASNNSTPAQDSKALTNSVGSDMKVMDQNNDAKSDAKTDAKTDAKALSPEASINPTGKVSQGKEQPSPTATPLASPANKALQPTQTETPLGSSDKNQEKFGTMATSEPAAQGVASSPTPTPVATPASEPREKSQATPADKDKAVGPVVPDSSPSPSSTAKRNEPPRSILALKPTELNSLDGKYVALIEQHKVIIRDTSANGLVFSSEHIWNESDMVTLLSWSEDNKLTYQVTIESLTQSFSIDLAAKAETVLLK